MKKSAYLWIYLLLIIIYCSTPSDCYAAIKILPEPDTPLVAIKQVQNVVNYLNQVLEDDMQVTLKRDVKLYICPTIENYQTVLERELKQSTKEAQNSAVITGGISSAFYQAVVIKCTPFITLNRFELTSIVGHELFHQVQAELSNNKMRMDKTLPWMIEGTADLIGARVAEKMGYQSMDKWKLDQINYLRAHPNHASVAEVIYSTPDKWKALMEQRQSPYQISDMMVFYLLMKKGGFEGIAQYFRLLGNNENSDTAFEKSFGITPENFADEFQNWFDSTLVQSSQGEFIVQEGVTENQAADFKKAFTLVNDFIYKEWKDEITASQRIIFTANKAQFSAAISKEFGTSIERAEKYKLMAMLGSTTIFNISDMSSSQNHIYYMATSMLQRYQTEYSLPSQLHTIEWLINGSNIVIIAQILESANISTVEKYNTNFLATLKKAKGIPDLGELQTSADWELSAKKYGRPVEYAISNLAAGYLVDKYGLASFKQWYLETKNSKNAKMAFSTVYGKSLERFNVEFKEYLSTQLQGN